MATKITLIAAVGRNGALGRADRLPWRLPSDLRRFRALSMGKPLVMGRKTWQSIGRPLPGRETVVVTRDRTFAAPGVLAAHGVDEALVLAAKRAKAMGAGEVAVVGGAEIYAMFLPIADRLAITEVDLAPDADAFFPTIEQACWRKARREEGTRGTEDEADFAFVDYLRR